jgi:hypothetical protein
MSMPRSILFCCKALLIGCLLLPGGMMCVSAGEGGPRGEKDAVLRFARTELQLFLSDSTAGHGPLRTETLFLSDASMKDGAFSHEIRRKNGRLSLTFRGGGPTEILHAVHGFLSHLGFRFGLDGTERPSRLRPDTLTPGVYTTYPHARWRGIRQHVNFPMDISSYPQEEAREYLRRMVRMRFNMLAVHSYPNLWHEVHTGDSTEYAGNFFYNRPHEIPGLPLIRDNIRFNRRYFSIPEAEPVYDDRKARSRIATQWMFDLLSYAKSIGLRVHFSVEPRNRGDIGYILDNCRSAIVRYPMIDELEVITEELGGWGNACSDSTVREVIRRQFGEAFLQDTLVTRVIRPQQTDLDNLLQQLGRNIRAVERMQADPWFRSWKVEMQLGIYCTLPDYAGVAYHLARTLMPGTVVNIMPGHGSVRTADHLARIRKDAHDLAMTGFLSWIEFDGLMFSQQNPIDGIEAMFRQLDTLRQGRQLHTVLYNHWRTAENALTADYAALSALSGPTDRLSFYRQRARSLGIRDSGRYIALMRRLEELDRICTNDLPNVGFCWIGAWLNGGPYTWMDRKLLRSVADSYDSLRATAHGLAEGLPAGHGRSHISLLENRLLTSHLYLSAFEAACEVQALGRSADGAYPASERQKAALALDRSLRMYERYMEAHVRMMPDRGCEGTLINLWHGPMYGVKVLRERIAGIPLDMPPKESASTDAPPLPILIGRQ